MSLDSGAQVLFEHIGIVVKDIERATKLLSSVLEPFGIGPWTIREETFTKDRLMMGEPCKVKNAQAKLGSGGLCLHQPLGGKSHWSDFLETRGEGIDHIRLAVPNWGEMVSKLEERGLKMALGSIDRGKRWGYFEVELGGFAIELAEQ